MPPVFDHLALFITARMISHWLRASKQAHAERISLQRQALVSILNRDRIIIGLEANASRRMDQHLRYWSQIRHMGWQGTQVTALKGQARGNRISAPGHRALLIAETILAKLCIDDFQVGSLWKRHEVIP